VVRWIRETEFPEYACRIITNSNNEIEIITRNFFGKVAELENEENEIKRKIKKKIREEINNPNIEFDLGYDESIEEQITEYKQDLKQALQFTKYEEFAEMDNSHLIGEELEKWQEISREKENNTESAVSYDLGRPDLAILWRKQLYFISSFDYINNYKLTVQIRARKCPLSLYY